MSAAMAAVTLPGFLLLARPVGETIYAVTLAITCLVVEPGVDCNTVSAEAGADYIYQEIEAE